MKRFRPWPHRSVVFPVLTITLFIPHGSLLGEVPSPNPPLKAPVIVGSLASLSGIEHMDLLADVDIFAKGAAWALQYEPQLQAKDIALIKKAFARGRERTKAALAGKHPWTRKNGRLARGYISAIDGSTQPFGLVIPERYDPRKPIRLDVVLHGSTRPVGLSELRFIDRFDEGDQANTAIKSDYIELHPLGRVENCYRWAGETDVFEAIAAVKRNYNIDSDRIVLRGMSMGASGTWHLGLKHPDFFVALGPYCGYVDTHQFSMTPMANFVKVGPLPAHQEKTLHMLDSVDFAANAGVIPAIACMGDKDPFFQAHVIMGRAMKKEGLELVNLISHGTGHTIDPATHEEQMRRIGAYVARGLDHAPTHLRFVTWTLKYSRCHWLQLLGLKEHYARAEIEARLEGGGLVAIKEPINCTRFALLPPILDGPGARVRIGKKEIALPSYKSSLGPRSAVFAEEGGVWKWVDTKEPAGATGKRPGLQGPIDDAFTTAFLCVRGTGHAWNQTIQRWSDAALKRFEYEWNRYFRGDIRIKNDTEVTAEDLQRFNLILFGDPGSNRWIAKALPKLPLDWTRLAVKMGDLRLSASQHAPILICPNPLPGAEGRYLVLNSGHTFHDKELASLNYLLFPRLGDWAAVKVGNKLPALPADPLDEEVIGAGFCDEHWKIKMPARTESQHKNSSSD